MKNFISNSYTMAEMNFYTTNRKTPLCMSEIQQSWNKYIARNQNPEDFRLTQWASNLISQDPTLIQWCEKHNMTPFLITHILNSRVKVGITVQDNSISENEYEWPSKTTIFLFYITINKKKQLTKNIRSMLSVTSHQEQPKTIAALLENKLTAQQKTTNTASKDYKVIITVSGYAHIKAQSPDQIPELVKNLSQQDFQFEPFGADILKTAVVLPDTK